MLGAPHFRSSAEEAALESASPTTRLAVRGLGPLLHRYEEEQTQSRREREKPLQRRVGGRGRGRRRRRKKKRRRKKPTAASAKSHGEATDFIDDAEIRLVPSRNCVALASECLFAVPYRSIFCIYCACHVIRKIYQRISHSSNRLASGRSPKHMEWRPDLPAKERRQIQVSFELGAQLSS